MWGNATLAIVLSSDWISVASMMQIVMMPRCGTAGAAGATGDDADPVAPVGVLIAPSLHRRRPQSAGPAIARDGPFRIRRERRRESAASCTHRRPREPLCRHAGQA